MLRSYSPDNTALLMVNPINHILSEGGVVWRQIRAVAQGVDMLANMRRLLAAARENGFRVVFISRRYWDESSFDSWRHPTPWQRQAAAHGFFQEGSWGADWHPDFAPEAGELVVDAGFTQNAFVSGGLMPLLSQHGIQKLIFTGAPASACIEATARAAADAGFHVTLATDATAAPSAEALRFAHEVCGALYAHVMAPVESILRAFPEPL
ncbi:cysteine hydrolase family protein [Radicibacter daui]|uniref:cysteine hydrolase family protein n=1 Tax=Radicibacter daui TaxID=3064829 RepID=UPI004046EA9A